jgi:ABC-2 type transport system permease protein
MRLLDKNILKQSVKNNWKLWLVLTGVLCFFTVAMTVAVPNMADSMKVELAAENMDGGGLLLSVYEQMIFGQMGIMLLLVFAVAVGNKLVASEVDKGTMSFALNTPITRRQVIFSKALFYVLSILLMVALVGLSATVSGLLVGIDIDNGLFWTLALGLFLYGLAISGICFLASCVFNKVGNSLLIGAGVPILFLITNSLSGLEALSFLKYFSLNSLFNPSAILAGESALWQFGALAVTGVLLYAVGMYQFKRKDLPL